MMRTVFVRSPSPSVPLSAGALVVPAIVVTSPDAAPAPSMLPQRPPPGFENGLLQVPRKVSPRPQRQRPTPLIRFDRPPPRLARHRPQPQPQPQPIPLPEPTIAPVVAAEEKDEKNRAVSVMDTLRGLERYCEGLVLTATQPFQELAAPKPVAANTAFKKAHRRVHSVDMSWNRAPPNSGRPGVATALTQRRKRSISSSDEIFLGAPKASLSRSERSVSLRRLAGGQQGRLPDLIEDMHATVTRGIVRSRSISVDGALSHLLRAPQPTMLSTRSGRADLGSVFSVSYSAASISAVSANTLLPEGLDLFPAATVVAAAGYYATLSAGLRQRVFTPLRRYITI